MPIYFIGSEGGPVKIGYCKDHNGIKIRMRGLQSASPQQLKILATIEGGLEKERELHKQFAAERLKGEWFKSDKKLLDYIGSLPLQMQRKRGRPRTGRNPQPLIACRLSWQELASLDRWARAARMTRSQAVREGVSRLLQERS